MILTAGLLVLVALGLLVAGVVSGSTALYWACVAVSVLAGVLLVAARRRSPVARPEPDPARRPSGPATGPGTVSPSGPVTDPASGAASGAREERSTGPIGSPGATASRRPAVPPAARAAASTDATIDVPADVPADVAGEMTGEGPPGELAPPPAGPPPAGPPPAPSLGGPRPGSGDGNPPVEEVEFTDVLLVMDLRDEVSVVDGHARYHQRDCPRLPGGTVVTLPLDQARAVGFSPCVVYTPDRHLAAVERARRSGRGR